MASLTKTQFKETAPIHPQFIPDSSLPALISEQDVVQELGGRGVVYATRSMPGTFSKHRAALWHLGARTRKG